MVTKHLPPQLEETADSSNITLVVSHPWLQEAFMRLLQDAGITVSVMTAPEELLQGVDETVDIVMVDVMAYQSQYRHLFEIMRQKHPGVVIIALLSEHTEYYAGDVVRAGANGIVIKENADTELLPTLYSLLSGRRITKISSRLLDAVKRCEALKQEEVNELVEKKKQEEQQSSFHLSRRSFLKASAATVAVAGGLAANPWSSAMKTLAAETGKVTGTENMEQIFAGACRGNCAGGCFLNIHVRDNKVVKTSMRELPDPQYNRVCVKGLTHLQRIYHPERLKYPMKRAGKRGEGKWERISWDEAITTIADKYKEYVAQYGKESFAQYTGSGQYALVNGMGFANSSNLFANVTGCTQIPMTVDAAVGHSLADAFGMGFLLWGNEFADLKNARTILCWGANPVISQIHVAHFLQEAKENGSKYVVIDPVYNTNASKADEFVPIRPGTDGALAFGMMNIIVRENWIDMPFLKKSTVAPFLVKDSDGKYLRLSDLGKATAGKPDDAIVVRDAAGNVGLPAEISDPVLEGSFEVNGIKVKTAYSLLLERIAEHPPEKAAEICSLPVEQIERITKLYANNKPSTIYMAMGPDHYTNGHYNIFAVTALAMLTGNIGKPGAFCGFGEVAPLYGNLATAFPTGATGPSISIPFTEVEQVMNEHKWGKKENINLKVLYVSHANPVNNGADRKKVLGWLDKFELIVMADMNMNETALYADILLPVAHWFEAEDLVTSYYTHPYVMWQDKAIEPLYECKPDFEILKMIAEKIGNGQYFNMDTLGYIDTFLNADMARKLGITRERMQKEKAVRCIPGSAQDPQHYIFAEGGVFGTATGRAQFYLENVSLTNYDARFFNKKYDMDKEKLPTWIEPYEAWHENPLYQKYPFIIISDHSRFRTHSQWWDVPPLLELDPEPFLKINPEDAAKLGVKPGDKVKVYNDRGYVVLHAQLNAGNQPGVLTAPKGWHQNQFIEGHISDLTQAVTTEICANQGFHDVLVAVQKL